MSILCYSDIRQIFYDMLVTGLYRGQTTLSVENDAIDKDGNPVLFACICDLPRIKRFMNAIDAQKRRGTIICFDFQKDALCNLFPERIHFQTISFEKWERSFFEES